MTGKLQIGMLVKLLVMDGPHKGQAAMVGNIYSISDDGKLVRIHTGGGLSDWQPIERVAPQSPGSDPRKLLRALCELEDVIVTDGEI